MAVVRRTRVIGWEEIRELVRYKTGLKVLHDDIQGRVSSKTSLYPPRHFNTEDNCNTTVL